LKSITILFLNGADKYENGKLIKDMKNNILRKKLGRRISMELRTTIKANYTTELLLQRYQMKRKKICKKEIT